MGRSLIKPRYILLLLVLLTGSVSLAYGYWWSQSRYVGVPPYQSIQTLASAQEHGVRVDLKLERDQHGTFVLASTYTPEDPTSHFYSMDLPRTGIQGIGRPTLLELPAQSGVQALGPVNADQPVLMRQVEGLSIIFPVYPDGAVTLRQPIHVPAVAAETTVVVHVSYMACSSQGYCMPPVAGKQLVVTLPIE